MRDGEGEETSGKVAGTDTPTDKGWSQTGLVREERQSGMKEEGGRDRKLRELGPEKKR